MTGPDVALVVAGGAGRRLGGVDKPALVVPGSVPSSLPTRSGGTARTEDDGPATDTRSTTGGHGGRTLLDIALAAVAGARIVVIGPHRDLAPTIRQVREDPPGSGPAAAVAAGVRAVPDAPDDAVVALLAADLPGVSAVVVGRLCDRLRAGAGSGVVAVDPSGRDQLLLSAFRLGALRRALDARPGWADAPLRALLEPRVTDRVAMDAASTADLDTPEDLAALDPHATRVDPRADEFTDTDPTTRRP
ncbi:molybdenum cofactor guanylyltransferase [Nakamurella alba]|uniref:molybdenum cofactor guanylyltransferase n=1 Tax=Nakamurella alba TaxID=2665158 RepID=UPI0018AB0A79|nr:nucleotidyltransferase family protein [Nakamurella alba]